MNGLVILRPLLLSDNSRDIVCYSEPNRANQLVPEAKLPRDHRGETGCQHAKVNNTAASVLVWSHLTNADQWQHKSDTLEPISPTFLKQCHRVFYVTFQLMWKDEGDKANSSIMSPPDDAIIWTENEFKLQLIWSHQFFETLVGVFNSLALNRPALSQYVWGLCYQGSTVLAKSNVRTLSSLDNRQGSHGADPSKVKVSSAICGGFPEKRRQVSGQEWDQL